MAAAKITRLADRGVVSVSGGDSEKLLQGLVTNDIEGLAEGEARHAGLLSPQGKILFDFFVVRHRDGYLLDVARAKAQDLVKRLTMYKLRADVAIADASPSYEVYAAWGDGAAQIAGDRALHFSDPRHPSLGLRLLADAAANQFGQEGLEALHGDYEALRVELGIPEGGKDYDFGDAYPHEADFDLLDGVSFTKGCYVGQEVVARMQNKTVVRKRAVKISANSPLIPNTDVLLGDIPVGRVGTVDANAAIAMLRLDRVLEAEQKSQSLTSGGIVIAPDEVAVGRYRSSAEARSSTALPSS
jgi:tRNA-modifying protein YgfZ